jgi:pyruvate dehydrogenase E2 component (dihydrolipoamide acetyltransferase)
MRAVALALRDVPEANAYWDAAAGASVRIPAVDVAVAVATEGGLLTPIVRSADAKSLQAIAAEVRELAGRARAGKLKPEEFTGGSFSVSNLGMFGLASFSAIINPPQGAILAVGGASRRTALGPSGTPVSRSVMSVTLSADHRLYDGVLAVALLDAFKGYMETPLKMLV